MRGYSANVVTLDEAPLSFLSDFVNSYPRCVEMENSTQQSYIITGAMKIKSNEFKEFCFGKQKPECWNDIIEGDTDANNN